MSEKVLCPPVAVCIIELKVFIAILIISGYNTLPSKAMYWSHDHDVYNKVVSSAMRRDRFDMLKKCLHFNATDMLDKMVKTVMHLNGLTLTA